MTEILVLAGPPRSGKTRQLVNEYCSARHTESRRELGANSLWIARNSAAVQTARSQLLAAGLKATLAPRICTLSQEVDALLATAPPTVRPLSRIQRRWLLSRLIESELKAGRLSTFQQLQPQDALLEYLDRALSDLQQRDMSPATMRSAAKRSGNLREAEVANFYATYVRQLNDSTLCDPARRIQEATQLLRANPNNQSAKSELLLLSGFAEPTPLESRLLVQLVAQSKRTILSLATTPYNGDRRGETSFMDVLEERFGSVTFKHTDEQNSKSACGDLVFLRQHLFCDPRKAPKQSRNSHAAQISLLPARSSQDEALAVARRVKELMLAGARASELLLVSRHTKDIAPRLRVAFDEVGVPFLVEGADTINKSLLARSMLAILRLHRTDWRRNELLHVITLRSLGLFGKSATLNYHSSDATDAVDSWRACRRVGLIGPRAATEAAVRLLNLHAGRKPLVDQLERMVSTAKKRQQHQAEQHSFEREMVIAVTALDRLRQLSGALEQLPHTATPLEWFDSLRQLLDDLCYQVCGLAATSDQDTAIDIAALEAIEGAFASLETLAYWQSEPTPSLSLSQIVELLEDWINRLPLDRSKDDEGRVRLVSAETGRQMRPKHLFLVGMGEQAFPSTVVTPATSEANHSPEHQAEHQHREMQLFYELVSSASDLVWLSYPALDDSAQPLNPSSFVTEIERLFQPTSLRVEPDEDRAPLSRTEVRIEAIRSLNEGDEKKLSQYLNQASLTNVAHSVINGVEISLKRASGDDFGPAEGLMLSGKALQKLSDRFKEEHHWSPSQLELYATCPFKFFMRQVLGIDPHDQFVLDLDYRRRGSLLHDAMMRFHQRLEQECPDLASGTDLDGEEFQSAFKQAVDDALQATSIAPHEASVARIEAMQAVAWGGGYREQLADYDRLSQKLDRPMKPTYFEARFGPNWQHDDSQEPSKNFLARDEPFTLQIDDQKVHITGRIDRIDLGEVNDQLLFNIIDYKTANSVKTTKENIRSGRQLQLFLYALATEQHLLAEHNALAWKLGYWAVRNDGFKPPKERTKELTPTAEVGGVVTHTEEWQSLQQDVLTRVSQIVSGIRKGCFPMFNTDEHCGGQCEFRTTCRVGQSRSLGKMPPDDVLPASLAENPGSSDEARP